MFRNTAALMAPASRCAALALLLCCSVAASATPSAPASGDRKLPSSVRFIDAPSAESPAARQKRLKKECKGRPNAGACLGHTGRD
jgi:hypothetical protein